MKCLNNSLFAALRFHPHSNNIYEELVSVENTIMGRGRREMSESAGVVEEIIEESMKVLLRENIIFSEQSLNDTVLKQNLSGPQNKNFVIGHLEGSTVETRRYSIRIFLNEKPIRPFSKEMMAKIDASLGKGGYVESELGKTKEEKTPRSEYLI